MKKILILVIVLILVIIGFIFIKENEMKSVNNLWNNLIASGSEAEEYENVINLRTWIERKDSSIEMFVTENYEDWIKTTDYNFKENKIKGIRIIIHWNNNQFVGEKWTPLNHENIWLFFQE